MNQEQILVTTYMDPDLDGFACGFAYAEFLARQSRPAVFGITGNPHEETNFLLHTCNIAFSNPKLNPADFNQIIVVDASEVAGINTRINLDHVIEVIDHRRVNDREAFKNAKIQIELVGSAATLIAEKFIAAKAEISKDAAVLLYGAIVSNTLNFKAKVTTDRDRTAANWLSDQVAPAADFVHQLFAAKSQINADNLAERINHDLAVFDFGQTIAVAQLEVVDGANLVAKLRGEILQQLMSIQESGGFDVIFLNLIDLEANQNIFVTPDQASQDLLKSIFQIEFRDNLAIRAGFIMRKEIMPLIRDKLTKLP